MDIIEYTTNRTVSFEEEPFNYMDAVVLSQLVYGRFEAAFDKPVAVKEMFKSEHFGVFFNDGITDQNNLKLLTAASCSRRYRDIIIEDVASSTDAESGEQFAVMTFKIGQNMELVCFRGTDGTLLGWEEDCELAFRESIPSQRSAVNYLNARYENSRYGREIVVAGHSKGGNLAIYSVAFCKDSVRSKISNIYAFDSPGFLARVSEQIENILSNSETEMFKYIPKGSIVGMLLDSTNDYIAIDCDAIGFMQHSIYTWNIEGTELVTVDKLSAVSDYLDKTMQEWFTVADENQRKLFVETLFEILRKNDIEVVSDFKKLSLKDVAQIRADFKNIDEGTAKALIGMLTSLVKSAVKQASVRGQELIGVNDNSHRGET